MINESALLAASKGLKAITLAEMEESRDKVRWGKERRSLALSDKEKANTAYHEAGHAILNELLEHTDPLHKVTIIPRGPALGVTMFLPLEDKYTHRKYELLDGLVVAMGGRVAEEIVFGDVTNGASGDIRQASDIARKMVCNWGMSEDLGMVDYGESQEPVFVARDVGSQRTYSEATAQKIDDEVKRLIDEAYEKATNLINKHRAGLEAIAQALLLYETINGAHVREIMEHGSIQNPPDVPTPPDLPAEPETKPVVAEEKEDNGGEDFSGELAPA